MKEKIKEICRLAKAGKISPDAFYDKLSEICEAPDTDGDTACLLEDVLMEIEMEHGSSGSMKKLTAEAAARILEEI